MSHYVPLRKRTPRWNAALGRSRKMQRRYRKMKRWPSVAMVLPISAAGAVVTTPLAETAA